MIYCFYRASICNNYSNHFWIIFDPFLNHFWTISEPFLNHFWTIFEPFLNHFWIIFESFLNHLWTDFLSIFQVNPSYAIGRSGIFRIFELSEWKLNLNSSDFRASKIIRNDTKVEPIFWEPKRENPLNEFCVGVRVGGHPLKNFSHRSNDARIDHLIFKCVQFWLKSDQKCARIVFKCA